MKHLGMTLLVVISFMIVLPFTTWSGEAYAQADPKFGVYVQDEAAVLQLETQVELYQNAVWLNERTATAQIGVVTIASLDGRTIEEIAVSTFRELGLGSEEKDNGVLLLYSADDHRVRIEVGYGLEGRITDGKAGAILDQYFLPNKDNGQIDQAFLNTQMALIQEVANEYGLDLTEIYNGNLPNNPNVNGQTGGFLDGIPGFVKFLLVIGILILIILDFKFTGGVVTLMLLSMFRRGGGSGRGGGWGGRGGGGSSGGGGASR